MRLLSAAEHRRELLLEYLRTGRISWPATAAETPVLVEWLRSEAERLVAEQPRGEGFLVAEFTTRVAMSFRLWQLLTPTTRRQWLRSATLPREEVVATLMRAATSPTYDGYQQQRVAAILFALREEDLPSIRLRGAAEALAGSSRTDWPATDRPSRLPAGSA